MASTSESMKEASKEPLVIDSRDGLKCDREKLTCVAVGDVIIRKGPYEMHSVKANAFMKKNAQGKLEINRVEAQDNVRFFGINGEKATADLAIYDMDQHRIDLKPAKGHQVVVWKDEYVLLSDFIYIHLKEMDNKKLELDKIVAKGHVKLSSPDELIEGDNAIMTPKSKLITITGNVKANRTQVQLRGSYAKVNLDTKVSTVLKRDDVSTDQRVKVFIYPEEVEKKNLRPSGLVKS